MDLNDAHLLLSHYLATSGVMLPTVFSKKGHATLEPSLEVLCATLHEQSNNEAEQSKNSSKDLNGEDLDEPNTVSKPLSTRAKAMETHIAGSAASARAALLPLMPTQTPQIRLHIPTVNPAQNRAYPVNMLDAVYICSMSVSWVSFEEKIMAMMTP
jgi:hypothetical protein